MKNFKNIFLNIQKLLVSVFYLTIILSTLTCKPPNVPSDLGKGLDNPNDPNSTNFVKPQVWFDSSLTVGENSVLHTRSANFAWHGNSTAAMFSWKLDTSSWSVWSKDTVLILNNIDDDPHTFYVRALHSNNTTTSEPSGRKFTTDLLLSPAIYIYPYIIERNLQEDFDLVLRIKKIPSLLTGHVLLKYEKSRVQIISTSADQFLASNSGSPVLIDENDKINGFLNLNFGVGLGSPKGISGTGSLVKIKVRGVSAGTASFSIVKDSLQVLDTLRQNVKINQVDSCFITIK